MKKEKKDDDAVLTRKQRIRGFLKRYMRYINHVLLTSLTYLLTEVDVEEHSGGLARRTAKSPR